MWNTSPNNARQRARDPESVKVLDIACGTGNQLIANKAEYPQIEMCGIDEFEGMLEQAKGKSQDITWIQGDMDQEELSIGAFDYISCQFAYHHFRKKVRFLENVYLNLTEDGWFSLINLDAFGSDDWYLYRFFPAAKAVDRQDFLRTDALIGMAQSVGFVVVGRESKISHERISIEAMHRNCSRRHSFSELTAIRDTDYTAGMSRIRDRLEADSTAVIESSVALQDIVFQKRR